MDTAPRDPEAMKRLGEYVRRRRQSLPDPTIRYVCGASGLSDTKWTDVEHGRGPHSHTTLRKVARGLGESPLHIFELAGIPYAELVTDEIESDRLSTLEARVGRMESDLSELKSSVALLVRRDK